MIDPECEAACEDPQLINALANARQQATNALHIMQVLLARQDAFERIQKLQLAAINLRGHRDIIGDIRDILIMGCVACMNRGYAVNMADYDTPPAVLQLI